MKNFANKPALVTVALMLVVMTLTVSYGVHSAESVAVPRMNIPNMLEFPDSDGKFATFSKLGDIDVTNPFFQDLGTNGRSCVTCHLPSDGWSITPSHLQLRFNTTEGRDPIFRTNDGSNCPTADVSTAEARLKAYSLLLSKGLIRVEIAVPPTAEYTVVDTANPYGCTSTSAISVYRRPLPSTNLSFLSTVMWDARETFKDASGKFEPIGFDLAHQAVAATLGHAQAAQPPTAEQVRQIVDFETQIFTAQTRGKEAGPLDDGAKGGPVHLSQQEFFLGINDPLGGNPKGIPFTSTIFTLFGTWAQGNYDEYTEARRAIARGERIFNTLQIPITGVGGLNDVLNQPVINGSCGTCHDSPNVGNHSLPAPLDIGLTDASQRTLDLPLITLRNNKSGSLLQVSDPGRALITGKWEDIGKFKGPILRGLASRAPYFHNGSAATLLDAVNFYDTRFNLKLSQQDKDDLVAFLKML